MEFAHHVVYNFFSIDQVTRFRLVDKYSSTRIEAGTDCALWLFGKTSFTRSAKYHRTGPAQGGGTARALTCAAPCRWSYRGFTTLHDGYMCSCFLHLQNEILENVPNLKKSGGVHQTSSPAPTTHQKENIGDNVSPECSRRASSTYSRENRDSGVTPTGTESVHEIISTHSLCSLVA